MGITGSLNELGPRFLADGTVEIRLRAPLWEEAFLVIDHGGRWKMDAIEQGGFSVCVPAEAGMRYEFENGDGRCFPDPVSRFQPNGAHGVSELVRTEQFKWEAKEWKGVPEEELIIYELHLGTFTEEGTYQAAIGKLDELVELGITAIELMPLAQCSGRWNWGYDGVHLFAPQNSYGRPEDLAALVDAAHLRGLAVILDVVYNHFGPEGNYLGEFGGYVSDTHKTPWGDAPNFDGKWSELARSLVRENVRHWLEDYRFDGLRVDATHFITDRSEPHIVQEIGEEVMRIRESSGRHVHLIAESNIYDPELVTSQEEGGHGFSHLWCDDFLHSVFAVLRPGVQMSSREYFPGEDLESVIKRGYVYQGTLTEQRQRHTLEKFPDRVRMESLVVSIQNHDFVGNHPDGRRLHQLTSPEAHRAAAALMLLSPSIPMLFMGEEYACNSPFYFFVDFEGEELRRAVVNGRVNDHPQHAWADVELPTSPSAFLNSRICESFEGCAQTLTWYRELLQLRRSWSKLGLLNTDRLEASWDAERGLARLEYSAGCEKYFVLVGLQEAGREAVKNEVQVRGEIILRRECEEERWDEETARLMMGSHAVIVGKGRVQVPGQMSGTI